MRIILDTMFHYPNKIKINKEGIAPLVSMVIISAVALIISANLAYIGHGEMEMSLASQKGIEATDIVNSCANDILSRFQKGLNYSTSSLLLSIGDDSCTINIVASSTERTVEIKSRVGDFNKKITLIVNISSTSVDIYDWKEY